MCQLSAVGVAGLEGRERLKVAGWPLVDCWPLVELHAVVAASISPGERERVTISSSDITPGRSSGITTKESAFQTNNTN